MDQDESQKRWTVKRRSALVVEILRGDMLVAEAARKYGLTVAEIEDWRDRFLAGAENALRSRPLDDETQKARDHAPQTEGRRVGDGCGYREGGHERPPFGAANAERVKQTVPTASTRTIYRILGVARSALASTPARSINAPTRN